jgi:hypothetical protein
MGSRGPKPGAKYKRNEGDRIVLDRRHPPEDLNVDTDRELIQAQHFVDRLDPVIVALMPIGAAYPVTRLPPPLVNAARAALELLEDATIAGISAYGDRVEEARRRAAQAAEEEDKAEDDADDTDSPEWLDSP